MFSPPPPPSAPAPPPNPPMFGQQAAEGKPKSRSMNPTFLGTGDIPSAMNRGQKTLLGT